MSDMKNGPVIMVLAPVALALWIRTFFHIIYSDNMRITKIIMFMVIVSIPPIGVIYPIIPLLVSIVKYDAKGAPQRLEKAGQFAGTFVSWFFRK
jgi:hypothetical protein